MAKKVRMEDADRISNLPDAVISRILSFLPTKEAIRTSILSTRWRYLFALVTNLDFELYGKSSIIKSSASFVDRVMFVHNTTSIEKFRLKCWQDVDSSRVCGWISAAVWRGIQHLDLHITGKFTTLPGVLFTCRTLVTLKLHIDFILKVPNHVCFPNLKILHLIWVKLFNDDSVKRLFSSCVCLEDMIIEQCELDNISNFNISNNSLKRLTIIDTGYYRDLSNYWIEIDAPMLVYFKYRNCQAAGYSLKNLHSLATADIDLFLIDDTSTYQVAATLFFRGICNVQSLILSLTSMKLLSICEPVPDFANMVQLSIFDYDASSLPWEGGGLETLLICSPELEKLTFSQEVFNEYCLPEKVPSCLLFRLKEIEILDVEVKEYCIKKAKYFLANARVLEKLTIRTRLVAAKQKQEISEELLASPRKSKQCWILIM